MGMMMVVMRTRSPYIDSMMTMLMFSSSPCATSLATKGSRWRRTWHKTIWPLLKMSRYWITMSKDRQNRDVINYWETHEIHLDTGSSRDGKIEEKGEEMIFNILMYQYQYIQLFKISLVYFLSFIYCLIQYFCWNCMYGQYILFLFINLANENNKQNSSISVFKTIMVLKKT